MTTKQKVFSHENNKNYIDYLAIKNGEMFLKKKKENFENRFLNRFISYQEFLNITKAYYQDKNRNSCCFYPISNMYQTNSSFINTEASSFSLNSLACNKNLGSYVSNTRSPIYFPNLIDLNKWCFNEKKEICDLNLYINVDLQNDFHEKSSVASSSVESSSAASSSVASSTASEKSCKGCGTHGLCKNATSLFLDEKNH